MNRYIFHLVKFRSGISYRCVYFSYMQIDVNKDILYLSTISSNKHSKIRTPTMKRSISLLRDMYTYKSYIRGTKQ